MINKLKKFAIIDDSTSPDTVINLSHFNEGPDGASEFGYSVEEGTNNIEDQQTITNYLDHTLEVVTLQESASDLSAIQDIIDNQRSIYISAITLDGGMLWGDAQTGNGKVKLSWAPNYSGDRSAWSFTTTRRGVTGYSNDDGLYSGGTFAGDNLLSIHEWADNDAAGLSDGWISSFGTNSFGSSEQTLEDSSGSSRIYQKRTWLPFVGQQITFSIDVVSVSGTYGTNRIEIEFYDSSGSSVASPSQSVSTAERVNVTTTIPSTAVSASCRYIASASTGTITTVLSDPALRLGTNSTYVSY